MKIIPLNEESSLHPVPENFDIVTLTQFLKAAKKLKLTDADIEELKQELKTRKPKASIGGGVYKFEWWPKRFNLGKKEGRVIYIEYIAGKKVWLVTVYPKNEKEDLTKQEQKAVLKLAKILQEGTK